MNLNKYHSSGRLYSPQEYVARSECLNTTTRHRAVLTRLNDAMRRNLSLFDKVLNAGRKVFL